MAVAFSQANTSENLPVARKYIFKVLEAGEKYYDEQKTSIELTKEMMMFLTEDLVSKPIIIGHLNIKDSNIDNNANIVVGRITRAFLNIEGFTTEDGVFHKPDNASYVEGFIDKQTGVDYINAGYLPSISYYIEDEEKSKTKRLVKAGQSNHLGLVKEPKFNTAVYSNDLPNNQRFIMSNNGQAIANGFMPVVEMKSQIANSSEMEEKEEDTDFKDTYYKDGEEEFSLEEVWDSIGEEMEKQASKKYYDKETFVKNGKTYNIKNMCDMYKSKKQVENEAKTEDKEEDNILNSNKEAEKLEEKSEDVNKQVDNSIQSITSLEENPTTINNSKVDKVIDFSEAGNSNSFTDKIKGIFSPAKTIILDVGGNLTYNKKQSNNK